MNQLASDFGDRVALTVIKKFDNLRPRGKPQGREWTVLAGFVVEDTMCLPGSSDSLWVITLATGNKCVGKSQVPLSGSVVHDSHAEVLARRALMLRLWKELEIWASSVENHRTDGSKEDVAGDYGMSHGRPTGRDGLLLEPNGCGAWRLRSGLRLHLYISDPPCGDASIYEQAPLERPPTVPSTEHTPSDGMHPSPGIVSLQDVKLPTVDEDGRCQAGQGTKIGSRGQDLHDVASEGDGNASTPGRAVKRYRCAVDGEGSSGETEDNRSKNNPVSKQVTERAPVAYYGGVDRMTFTGAKIAAVKENVPEVRDELGGVLSGMGARDVVLRIDREQEQMLGVLRIKSSRSNISEEGRTLSMSCSDKVAKWMVLGLQGGLLASWMEPLFLSSIVLGADPRTAGPEPLLAALRRAVPDRAAKARFDLGLAGVTYPAPWGLNVLVAERVVFDKCKTQAEKRAFSDHPETLEEAGSAPSVPSARRESETPLGLERGKGRRRRRLGAVPSGTSINWICPFKGVRALGGRTGSGDASEMNAEAEVEVTLSATGRMQGAVSRGILNLRMRSRLCRARLLEVSDVVRRLYLPRLPPRDDRGMEGSIKGQETTQQQEKGRGELLAGSPPASESCPAVGAERCASSSKAIANEFAAQAGTATPSRQLSVDGECSERPAVGVIDDGIEGELDTDDPVVHNQRACYWQLKQANQEYCAARAALLETGTFRGWLVGRRDYQEFSVDKFGVVPLVSLAS